MIATESKDLRRILILMQILKYNIEDFKSKRYVQGQLKDTCNNTMNAMLRFKRQIDTPGTAIVHQINHEMKADYIHDISLLIDEAMYWPEIGHIIEELEKLRKDASM